MSKGNLFQQGGQAFFQRAIVIFDLVCLALLLSSPLRAADEDVPAYVSYIEKSNYSPFEKAILSHNLPLVKELLEHNKSLLNPKDTSKGFPLMYAVITNSPAITEYLLQKGAQIEATMEGGVTAMAMAVHWNLIDIVKVMVNNKVDLNRKINGVTYLDTAYLFAYQEMVEYLKSVHAKTSNPGVKYAEIREDVVAPINKKSLSLKNKGSYNRSAAGGSRSNRVIDTGRNPIPVNKVELNANANSNANANAVPAQIETTTPAAAPAANPNPPAP